MHKSGEFKSREMTEKKLIIITAPSGAGKTSITRHLLAKFPKLSFSISATTREKRSFEREGVDYHFLSSEAFQEKITNQEFVEWEMVYEGRYYGTLKSELQRIWEEGRIPVLDIDVKGAIHVQQQYTQSALSIFVDPPSVEELRKRLLSRGTETGKSLQDRINKASYEISFKQHFDRIIVNMDLEQAFALADQIIEGFVN